MIIKLTELRITTKHTAQQKKKKHLLVIFITPDTTQAISTARKCACVLNN
jgi:hypothetical protein